MFKEKGTPWEGAIRTVSFLWSPLIRDQQRVYHGLMHITDWLPTLYSAAGKRLLKKTFRKWKSNIFFYERAIIFLKVITSFFKHTFNFQRPLQRAFRGPLIHYKGK